MQGLIISLYLLLWPIALLGCLMSSQEVEALQGKSELTSRSRNTQRGTCLPAPVSEKKVLKASSPPPIVLSLGICPSGWMPEIVCIRVVSQRSWLPLQGADCKSKSPATHCKAAERFKHIRYFSHTGSS